MFSDEVKRIEDIEKNIRKRIEDTLGLSVQVKLVEPKSIERSQGKAKRVIDKRKI
jgi:phenylacetate-CoA ligase